MYFLLAIVVSLVLFPATSYALPTPDVLVSLVNIVPLLTGTAVAAGGGFFYALSNLLKADAKKLLLFGFAAFSILAAGTGYVWNQHQRSMRIANLSMYMRCDMTAHVVGEELKRLHTHEARAMWREYGNIKDISIEDIPQLLDRQPDATLIDSPQNSISYFSGMPTVKVKDQLLPFSYVRPMELTEALKVCKTKDVYLRDFRYIGMPPESYPLDKEVFRKFENIYIVHRVKFNHRYVTGQDGKLRPVRMQKKLIEWPVEEERWVMDDERILFPGITDLLPDEEVAELFDRPQVYIVAPYSSIYRSRKVYEGIYLKRLLHDVDHARVLPVDLNLPDTTRQLAGIAQKLDGKEFIVIGVSKHDWLYEGMDAAFQIWESMGHDPGRFRLIGFNTRLPEVAALRAEARTSKGLIDLIRGPFWEIFSWIRKHFHVNNGIAILVVAVVLRLLLFPACFSETCSRMKRARIKQIEKSGAENLWRGKASTLLRYLNVRKRWEFLGTFVLLILVLPAYRILSVPPKGFVDTGFLWIAKLSEPDYLLSVIVVTVIFLKMRLGVEAFSLPVSLLLSIGFFFLLAHLPSSLLVYVSGVLSVTVIQDLIALRRTETTINRALLMTR